MLNLDFKGILMTLENVISGLDKRERLENKVTKIDENSTNEEYPSAQAVREYVQQVIEELNNN